MNNFDPEQIASAYRYLANSDPNVVSDESLITVYNHLINYCGSPLPARQALLIIAWTRSSEELLQAVNNEGATFEQAVAYFGVASDTPSTEIGRLVGMYMNSDEHHDLPSYHRGEERRLPVDADGYPGWGKQS
jgi:hypothetical protein